MMVNRDHVVNGGILLMVLEGPTSWGLAWVTRLLDRRDEASEHYERALEVVRRTGGRPVHALIALEYAHYLAEEGGAESRARAGELAEIAKRIANEVGMPAVLSEADRLVKALPGANTAPPGAAPEPQSVSIAKAGDSWLVTYDNVEFHLKDVRGVQMLAKLVREPGREFHVLDLSGGAGAQGEPVDRGDSGEAIDDEARRQYRARVLELREELQEAEGWNDLARAERVRTELDAIQRELSHAVGLGGRERRMGAAAERARINVQRRIRDAIRRIEGHHPALAKHLDRAVRTGAYCSYEP
jgi:hypothetical protein